MGLTKKIGIGVVASLLLGGLIFGRDFFSYGYTAVSKVRESIKSNVPISFEIERAKEKVRSIVPEIQKNLTSIAREEQSLENLTKQIASLEEKQSTAKADMLTLQQDLEKNGTQQVQFVYSERKYTRSQVENDLAKRLERYQTNAVSLETMQKTKTIREKSLDTARQKLTACMSSKRDLEVTLETLASRLKMIELQKTTSSYAFDDSAIGDAKKTIAEIQNRLSVEEKLIGAAEENVGDINLAEQQAVENISQKVKSYFSGPPATEKGLVKE